MTKVDKVSSINSCFVVLPHFTVSLLCCEEFADYVWCFLWLFIWQTVWYIGWIKMAEASHVETFLDFTVYIVKIMGLEHCSAVYPPMLTEIKFIWQFTCNLTLLNFFCRRIIFLETVAGVPGMVAAMTRHLQSLRKLRRDHGWIHTLLGKKIAYVWFS